MATLLTAILAAGAAMYRNPALMHGARNWVGNLLGNPEAGYPPDKFRVDMVDRINYRRITAHQSLVHVDVDLQSWMDTNSTSLDLENLNALAERIKIEHPRYYRILACTASSSRLQDLLGEFQDFCSRVEQDTTHVAIHLIKLKAGLGYQGLIVTGRRLEDLTPEALSARKTDTFFNTCPHCGNQHASKVIPDQRGINLECPKCQLSYGVLSADTSGNYRYVNEFLTGYHPPAHFSYETNRLHEMYLIWDAVVRHCKYVKDSNRQTKKRDVWQTSLETQNRSQGDCEDSAVFLADWLMARGYQVRVALGHYGDMGGHAWCVVRLDGTDYLLESTEGPPDPSKPPYVTDVGARYVPDTLFDRDAIYVRSKPRERFHGDYWSPKAWIKIQPRELQNQRLAASQARLMKPIIPGAPPVSVPAKTTPIVGISAKEAEKTQPLISDIELMKTLATGTSIWQVPVTMEQRPITGAKSH